MITKQDLYQQNPWWLKDSNIKEEQWPTRELYNKLKKEVANRFVLAILGLRRVGKSTILKQLIAYLLKNARNKKNIFYFSFDQYLIIKTPQTLENILQIYFAEILQKQPAALKEKVYIFLDEIQYIDFWQDIIKRYYDLSFKIKFIISGSQRILLQGKSRESLAGRIFEYNLEPLNFNEYLQIKSADQNLFFDCQNIFKVIKKYDQVWEFNYQLGKKAEQEKINYLFAGQFPEILNLNKVEKYNYIKESIIGKILETDLPKLYRIEEVAALKNMAFYFIENSGSIFSLNNIIAELGINKRTGVKYIEILQKGNIINLLYRHSKSAIKKEKLLKKAYAYTSNFTCAYSGFDKAIYEQAPEVVGKIIESYIFNILSQQANNLNYNFSFFRKGDKEIDFLVEQDKNILPIEVKFTNKIRKNDFAFLLKYCIDKKIKKCLVITKNHLDKKVFHDVEVYFIPWYIF